MTSNVSNPLAARDALIERAQDGRPFDRKLGRFAVVWYVNGPQDIPVVEIHAPWASGSGIRLQPTEAVRNMIRALEAGLAWMEARQS